MTDNRPLTKGVPQITVLENHTADRGSPGIRDALVEEDGARREVTIAAFREALPRAAS